MSRDTVVLRAKLMAPRLPRGHVPRRRLLELLNPPRPLTLICAPAGFGKTVAVGEWLAASEAPVAWLALDEGDNDAARFFLHLVAALQTVAPACGQSVTRAADQLRDSDVSVHLESLANQLHEIEAPFFLVLDDYHAIRSPAVHDTVGFLVEHMPPVMQLVMTSRREPPLPIARWRLRQWLTELGEDQLRFAADEASRFLSDTMELDLTADQLALLEERTEGWVGGLQLAGLSLRQRPDRDAFLRSFAGDDRYVMDYLTAEVLAAQPAEIRRFLLRTSVLDRMNASLSQAVTGASDCAAILEQLERERTFVVSLDNKRDWYRYHHLFQSLLQHQLAASDAERAADCHLAASRWFEGEGAVSEAAQHALRAGDAERVADLIGSHGMRLAVSGRSKQVLQWARQIPESALERDPQRLRAALWCEYIRGGVVRDDWRRRLAGRPAMASELSLFEIYQAARDPQRYAEARDRASALLADPESSPMVRINAHAIAASCAHALGEVATAFDGYAEGVTEALDNGYASQLVFMAFGHARVTALRDGPAAGLARARACLALAAERGWDGLPVAATLHYAVAMMQWECGDHPGCAAALERALSLGENEPSTVRHLVLTALARLRLWQGRPGECDELLGLVDAEAYIRPLIPLAPDVDIERAWLELARGELDPVEALLAARGFGSAGVGDAMASVHGQQDAGPLLVGRYLLARRQHDRAVAVLTAALDAARRAGRRDTVLRCRVDLAAARFAAGDHREAAQQLDAAADMALGRDRSADRAGGPTGYVRVFLDAPDGLDALMRRCLDDPDQLPARRALFERALSERGEAAGTGEQPSEPLSPSETRVLQQLVAGLSNKEIAGVLFISPNTLKTHIRRVYRKLGARNRADAIRLAHSLGLLDGPG